MNLLTNQIRNDLTTSNKQDCIDYLSTLDVVSLDIETNGLIPFYNDILLIALGSSEKNFVIDVGNFPEKDIKEILKSIEDKLIIGHGFKFDLKFTQHKYNILFKNVYCTMVASQVLYNGWDTLAHSLEATLQRDLSISISKEVQKTFLEMAPGDIFTTAQLKYACNDIIHLKPLYDVLQVKLTRFELTETIKLEMQFLPVLVKMELKGLLLDTKKWKELALRDLQETALLLETIVDDIVKLSERFNLLDNPFTKNQDLAQLDLFNPANSKEDLLKVKAKAINLSSPLQVKELYRRIGIIINSTGESVLNDLVRDLKDEDIRTFTTHLLKHRELSKRNSTYGLNVIENINKVTGRLHSDFSQTFTDTGRLSSRGYKVKGKEKEGINFQNIPARNEVRHCFIASLGHMILTIDYSGQEVVLLASQSQDRLLLSSVNDGIDFHSDLAQRAYRIIKENNTFIVNKTTNKDLRTLQKNVNFAFFYGVGINKISAMLNISWTKANAIYKMMQAMLKGLVTYQNSLKGQAKKTLIVKDKSFTNRMKYFYKYYQKRQELHEMEKEAMNFPVQASAASMIKLALIETDKYLESIGIKSGILLTVHDEIVFELPITTNTYFISMKLVNIMETVAEKFLSGVKMKCDYNLEKHWTK